MGTAKRHPVPDRVKPSFASGLRVRVPGCQKLQWRLNPVWHKMFYSCTHMATVGVKGLTHLVQNCEFCYKPALSTWSVELHSAAFILGWNVILSLYLQHFCHLQRNLAVQILRIKVLVGSLDLEKCLPDDTVLVETQLNQSINQSLRIKSSHFTVFFVEGKCFIQWRNCDVFMPVHYLAKTWVAPVLQSRYNTRVSASNADSRSSARCDRTRTLFCRTLTSLHDENKRCVSYL